jgi:hypothetical protein
MAMAAGRNQSALAPCLPAPRRRRSPAVFPEIFGAIRTRDGTNGSTRHLEQSGAPRRRKALPSWSGPGSPPALGPFLVKSRLKPGFLSKRKATQAEYDRLDGFGLPAGLLKSPGSYSWARSARIRSSISAIPARLVDAELGHAPVQDTSVQIRTEPNFPAAPHDPLKCRDTR